MSGAHVISINWLKMTDKWQPRRNKWQTVYRTHYMLIKGINSLASSFWTYWLFCIALVKASEGQTQFWVLSCSWVLLIWVWSLPEVRLRTDWAVSCGPWASSWGWHVYLAVHRDLRVSAFISATKAGPGRSQHRASVYLHQYCVLNIVILEKFLKKSVIYKILCQAAEQTENLNVSTESKQCLWLKTENAPKSNCSVSLRIQTMNHC